MGHFRFPLVPISRVGALKADFDCDLLSNHVWRDPNAAAFRERRDVIPPVRRLNYGAHEKSGSTLVRLDRI